MSVCLSAFLIGGPQEDGFSCIRYFVPCLVGHKKSSNDVFGDVVAHDLDPIFNG